MNPFIIEPVAAIAASIILIMISVFIWAFVTAVSDRDKYNDRYKFYHVKFLEVREYSKHLLDELAQYEINNVEGLQYNNPNFNAIIGVIVQWKDGPLKLFMRMLINAIPEDAFKYTHDIMNTIKYQRENNITYTPKSEKTIK